MQRETKDITTQLQATLDRVWMSPYSPLYTTHWKENGVHSKPILKNPKDLLAIPLITRDIFSQYKNPRDRCFLPPKDLSVLASTSGSTTGEPLFVWLSGVTLPSLDLYSLPNIRHGITLWGAKGDQSEYLNEHRKRGISVNFVDPRRIQDVVRMMNEVYTDAFVLSTPSVIALLASYITNPVLLDRIKFISLSGEAVSKTTYSYIQKKFHNALIFNEIASTEMSGSGFCSSPYCDGGISIAHVDTENFYLEIDAQNEMILTSLKRSHATPLIRYKTGDCATWHPDPCPCGNEQPRIRLLGRRNVDFVRTRGMEFRIEYIDAVLSGLTTFITPKIDARVIEKNTRGGVSVHVHLGVEKQEGVMILNEALREHVREAMHTLPVSSNLNFKQALDNKLIDSFEIEILETRGTENKNKSIRLLAEE